MVDGPGGVAEVGVDAETSESRVSWLGAFFSTRGSSDRMGAWLALAAWVVAIGRLVVWAYDDLRGSPTPAPQLIVSGLIFYTIWTQPPTVRPRLGWRRRLMADLRSLVVLVACVAAFSLLRRAAGPWIDRSVILVLLSVLVIRFYRQVDARRSGWFPEPSPRRASLPPHEPTPFERAMRHDLH